MYQEGFDRPKMSTIVLFAVGGVPLLLAGVGFSTSGDPLGVQALFSLALMTTGGLLLGFSTLLGLWYADAVFLDARERRKEIEAITPRRREIEAIGQLTAEQLAVVPRMDHGAKITEHKTRDAQGKWITSVWFSTPGGEIPLEFVQDFLKHCGFLQLYPVNSYSEGTFSYHYARWFTDWLRKEQLAIGGEGSKSGQAAQWITSGARLEVCKLFDVELNLDMAEA